VFKEFQVLRQRWEFVLQHAADPPGKIQAAGANGPISQLGVVQCPQPDAHDQHYGQVEPEGDICHCLGETDGREPASCPLHERQIMIGTDMVKMSPYDPRINADTCSIGGNVWLTQSVPWNSNVTQAKPRNESFDDGAGI